MSYVHAYITDHYRHLSMPIEQTIIRLTKWLKKYNPFALRMVKTLLSFGHS